MKIKKFLTYLLIVFIVFSSVIPGQVYATRGDAIICSRYPTDSNGNTITWDGTAKTIFEDKAKNYMNLYCMDAGTTRGTNDVKISESYITDFLTIDSVTKFNIFKDQKDYNSMLWFADNMYLLEYDEKLFSSDQIKQLKKENMEAIKQIIISQIDYLKTEETNKPKIEITEEWINNKMFQIINIDNFEDTLSCLNAAITWQLARNTEEPDKDNSNVIKDENLVKDHMTVKHIANEQYYTECDGNILCLWNSESEHGAKHFNFYNTTEENEDIQNALKAYYFGMLHAARENSNYSRFKDITINEENAKTSITDNGVKIGPFKFNNYNKEYIKNYTLTINNNEIKNDEYEIKPNAQGEFYINILKDEYLILGDNDINLKVDYNYGIYKELYVIGNELPGHQPLISVNYTGKNSTDKQNILINTTLREVEKECPNLKVTKTVNKTVVEENDEITYTIEIKNTGNVDLTNVSVTDEMLKLNETIEKLIVGESKTLTIPYTVTKADMNIEEGIVNKVTATAMYMDKKIEDSDSVTIVPKVTVNYPNLKVTKTVDKAVVEENDEITYTIKVENIGNVELANVSVIDEMLKINETIEILGVGESKTLTIPYTVTKENVNTEGGVVNTATATAMYNGKKVEDSDSVTIVPRVVIDNPNLKVTKTVNKTAVEENDEITYTIEIKNTGNVDLTNVSVTDEMLKVNETIEKLVVGESKTLTIPYTITKTDMSLKEGIINKATATAIYNGKKIEDSDSVTVVPKIVESYPNIKITKTVNKTVVEENDEIIYTIEVKNIGNVDLTNIIVTDEMLGINETIESLVVGESQFITKSYIVTKEDVNSENGIINTATVTAVYNGKRVEDLDSVTIVPKVIKVVEKEVIKVVEKEVEKEVEVKKDTTVSKDIIPAAGQSIMLTIIISTILINIYIAYRYLKNHK